MEIAAPVVTVRRRRSPLGALQPVVMISRWTTPALLLLSAVVLLVLSPVSARPIYATGAVLGALLAALACWTTLIERWSRDVEAASGTIVTGSVLPRRVISGDRLAAAELLRLQLKNGATLLYFFTLTTTGRRSFTMSAREFDDADIEAVARAVGLTDPDDVRTVPPDELAALHPRAFRTRRRRILLASLVGGVGLVVGLAGFAVVVVAVLPHVLR